MMDKTEESKESRGIEEEGEGNEKERQQVHGKCLDSASGWGRTKRSARREQKGLSGRSRLGGREGVERRETGR